MTQGIFGFREKAPDYRRPMRPGSLSAQGSLGRPSFLSAAPPRPPDLGDARFPVSPEDTGGPGDHHGQVAQNARASGCRGLGSWNLTQAPANHPRWCL